MTTKKAIAFGKYEFSEGDSFMMPSTAKRVRIIAITQDTGQVYVTLRYGEAAPELMRAEVFAYYVTSNVYVPNVLPKYQIGNRFVQNYNNQTLEILAISPSIGSASQQYVYFCTLQDENGNFTYVAIEELYFSRMMQIDNAGPAELPKPVIPPGTELPEVTLYDKDVIYPPCPTEPCTPDPCQPIPPEPTPEGTAVMQVLDEGGNVTNEVPLEWKPSTP